MTKVELIVKTERIVRALKELGVEGFEEVAETKVNDLVECTLAQTEAHFASDNEAQEEVEFLGEEVVNRILKEGKEALIKIIDRAYQEAYYEPLASKEDSLIKI